MSTTKQARTMSAYPESSRRPFYRAAGMPLQRYLACPIRRDGHTADGMAGDCLRTAIAGALGLERDTVPHFVSMPTVSAEWWWELQRWAREQLGDVIVYAWSPERWREVAADYDLSYPGGRPFTVIGGPSPRGPFDHAMVGDLDLEPVHDPHPLGMGLRRVDEVYAFVEAKWDPPARHALEAPR